MAASSGNFLLNSGARGLWSVKMTIWYPKMINLNSCKDRCIARNSFFVVLYLRWVQFSVLLKKAMGLSFLGLEESVCIRQAPIPTSLASVKR